MNKTLFVFLVLASFIGSAYSACDTSCTTCGCGGTGPACTTANSICTACSTGQNIATVQTGGYVNDGCSANACHSSCAANTGTCSTTGGTCSGCKAGYKVATVGGINNDGCLVYATATPETNSPSSVYSVTPVAVFTSVDITSPAAFAYKSMATTLYGPGFDDSTNYVWSVQTSGTNVAVYRRTVNGSFVAQNSSDTAITTTVTSAAYMGAVVGQGYLAILSYVEPTNFASTATSGSSVATAGEISVTYIATNGTSATTKAVTGNTNVNAVFAPQGVWIDTGILYVAWLQYIHTPGSITATGPPATTYAVDTFTCSGLYIQAYTLSSGAVYYNTTGGVKAIALTASNSGTGSSPSTVNNDATMPMMDFSFGSTNYTNSSTVNYIMSDNTAITSTVLAAIKTGTITLATGAGTTPATLATGGVAGTGAASASNPIVTTIYSGAGFLGSTATSGVFVQKMVSTNTGTATNAVVYSIMGYYNGSATATANVTIATGYGDTMIQGFQISGGFVLIEYQDSTSTTANTPNLLQAERFFTNGTANGTAVALGTFLSMPTYYNDANGSIIVAWTAKDTANLNLPYSGMMGKYLSQMLSGSILTSIIGLLSLFIFALFAF